MHGVPMSLQAAELASSLECTHDSAEQLDARCAALRAEAHACARAGAGSMRLVGLEVEELPALIGQASDMCCRDHHWHGCMQMLVLLTRHTEVASRKCMSLLH